MTMLEGQVVLITGCSSGIGRALAAELGRRGHHVYATARNPETLSDLTDVHVRALPLDVNDPVSVDSAVQAALDATGRIDMLINNAGVSVSGPLAELPLSDVQNVFDTNVMGLVRTIQAVFPSMARRRSGRIVNLGSVVGILPTPFAAPYCASKSAVHMLSDILRMEVAPFGIDVVVVQPGAVRSSIADSAQRKLARNVERFKHYAPMLAGIEKRTRASQEAPMDAALFAARVCDEILLPKAPWVVRSGNGASWMPRIAALPDHLLHPLLARRFGLK